MIWHRWIGLPHQFRADPDDGQGADCLVMTWHVLDAAGVPHPALNTEWLDMAERGDYESLSKLYRKATIDLGKPEEHAVTMFRAAQHIGIGVVVDGGLLHVNWRKGVCWIPVERCRKMEYRRFK
tara:strand:- start:733 stop:1104 length:372 start_codon:yes stop_codon:yes gene_type:complete